MPCWRPDPDVQTPPLPGHDASHEKLKSLPAAERFLKPGRCFQALDASVAATSDNQAADQLNQAGDRLFQSIPRRPRSAA
jgi:hypothetical protein